MRIAFVGTRGIPAAYGGFETAVEEIGSRLAERGHEVRVYRRGRERPFCYKGISVVSLPAIRVKSLETLSHTALSVGHLLCHRVDAAVVMNVANAPLARILKRAAIPVALHLDGLEWMRGKWGPVGKMYYKKTEKWAAGAASELIADSGGIVSYYQDRYGVEPVFIPYGAGEPLPLDVAALHAIGLSPGRFHLSVARLEPENQVLEIIQGYVSSAARLPLVVVGDVPYRSNYKDRVLAAAAGDSRVLWLGSVYEQSKLDSLYRGALSYIHGHSVGGTNPSLLRAMAAGSLPLVHGNVFNLEVVGPGSGVCWRGEKDLFQLIDRVEMDPSWVRTSRTETSGRLAHYSWDGVAEAYEGLCIGMASR